MPETSYRNPERGGTATAERPPVEDKKLRVVLTGLDQNVDAFAREAAHEQMKSKHEGPIWKRIAKNAWNGLMQEYQLVKATQKARQEILENNNLRHHQGQSDEKWREAVTMRYSSEYGEQLIHDGETFHKLNSPEAADDPNAERITGDIKDLHRRAARGEFVDDESLNAEVDRLTEGWNEAGISQQYIGEGQLLASNVAQSCRELEGMVNSVEGLSAIEKEALAEQHLAEMQVIAGEARVGSRTEIEATISERIAEKLRKAPFLNEGRIARVAAALNNEMVVAAMMTGAIYAAKRGASMAGKVIAPGIGAGIVAGIRERNKLHADRAFEARRADAGQEPAQAPDEASFSKGRRLLRRVGLGKTSEEYRAELNATQYESRPAEEVLSELGEFYNESGELNITNREDMQKAMTTLGEIRARIRISDRTGARLINFADISSDEMESRRFDVDIAMAKLESDMEKMMENPVAQAMMDIKPDEKFEESYDMQSAIAEGMLMGEMQHQDRLFSKLVRKEAFKGALKGTIFGMGLSALAHLFNGGGSGSTTAPTVQTAAYETDLNSAPGHVGNVAPDHVGGNTASSPGGTEAPDHVGSSPSPNHVGSQTPDHVRAQTPDYVGVNVGPDHVGTNSGPDHVGDATPNHVGTPEHADMGESAPISDTSKMNLPEGYKVESSSNGTITMTGPDGTEYSDLALNQDGSLSDNAIQTLKSHGFSISDQQEVIQGKPEVSHPTVSPNQFYENHKDAMTTIHRTKWVDGDVARTGLHEFTLRTDVDASGNVIISIDSPKGASGVNWQGALEHIKAYATVSRGTQAHAIPFQFGPDGKAVVPNGSAARELFEPNGQMKGTGFLEAGLSDGKAPDGGENIAVLATAVGNGNENIQDTITTPTLQTAHVYTVQSPAHNTGLATPTTPSSPSTPQAVTHTPSAPGVSQAEGLKDALVGGAATLGVAGLATGAGVGARKIIENRAAAAAEREAAKAAGTEADDDEKNNADTSTNSADAKTGDDSEATGGKQEKEPSMSDADKKFFDELDAENLNTITGYDFADYAKMGMRERKQAMRFIDAALTELGGSDKVAVVARAQELAQDALSKAGGPMAELFKNTMDVLQQSAERVERDTAKGPKANIYLNDLDSETAAFPFGSDRAMRFNADSYPPKVQKLVARIYNAAQNEAGPRPDGTTDPDGNKAWYKDVFRRVQRIAHPDQYPDLSDEDRDLFSEAQKVFTTVKSRYVKR